LGHHTGRLITFEGGEGSGKTTQLQRLQTWLQESGWLAALSKLLPELDQPLLITREPGGTPLGQQLRQLLLDPQALSTDPLDSRTEMLLYAADRSQHVATRLQPQLAAGGLVLCDRFTDSTVAYQGYGRGLDLGLIGQLNQIASNGLVADLTFFLDLEVKTGLERARQRANRQGGGLDRMETVELDFHQRVRQGFQQLSQQQPTRIVTIDASPDLDKVATKIQTLLAQRLNQWYPQLSTNLSVN
jgi:dTMP kinase